MLTLASVVGTLIQQNQDPIFYKKNFPGYYDFIYLFSLHDMYHSVWFYSLIALLCINIAVCTARRFGAQMKAARIVNLEADEAFLKNQRHFVKIAGKPGTPAPEAVRRTISERGYAVAEKEADGRHYFFGNYGAYSFLGEFAVHVSLLTIILGALVGNVFGYKTQISAFPGETWPVPTKEYHDLETKIRNDFSKARAEGRDNHSELGALMKRLEAIPRKSAFDIRIDDFRTEYTVPESATAEVHVKNWHTTLTVLSGTVPVLTKTISVNDPLSFGGIDVYQASYGRSASGFKNFRVLYFPDGASTAEATLLFAGASGSSSVEFRGAKIRAAAFLPDFRRDGGQDVSASDEPNNPVLKLEISGPGTAEARTVRLFQKMPDFSHEGMGSGKGAGGDRFVFDGFEADEKEYTGLQVACDPGVNMVWAGSALMMIGFFWAFYMYHKRVWFVVDKDTGRIVAGGTSNKNHAYFGEEFSAICAAIETEVKK